jgi:hypothetical protein
LVSPFLGNLLEFNSFGNPMCFRSIWGWKAQQELADKRVSACLQVAVEPERQ